MTLFIIILRIKMSVEDLFDTIRELQNENLALRAENETLRTQKQRILHELTKMNNNFIKRHEELRHKLIDLCNACSDYYDIRQYHVYLSINNDGIPIPHENIEYNDIENGPG